MRRKINICKKSFFKKRIKFLVVYFIFTVFILSNTYAHAIWYLFADSDENDNFIQCKIGYITASKAMIETNNMLSPKETSVQPLTVIPRRTGFWGWTDKGAMQMNDVSQENFNVIRLYIGLPHDLEYPDRLEKVHFPIPEGGFNSDTPLQQISLNNFKVTIWGNNVNPPFECWRGWGLVGTFATFLELNGSSLEAVIAQVLVNNQPSGE